LEEARHLLNVVATSIWMIDPDTEELVCRQATGPQNELVRGWRLSLDAGLVGWTARSGESLIVPDILADERHYGQVDQKTELSLRALLSIPLKVKQHVIGVIQAVDTKIDRFTTADLEMLEPLASGAAIAIENARLYEETNRLRTFNETIVQSLEEGILLEDAGGQIVFVNPKAAELLGYTPQELVGRHWADIVAPGNQVDIERDAQRAAGIAIRYETALMTKAGNLMPVIVSARWLYEQGRLSGVLSAFTDISARRQAEEALRHREEHFRALIEHAPDMVGVLNKDGSIRATTYASAAVEHIAGYSMEELAGQILFDLVHPNHLAQVTDLFTDTIRAPNSVRTTQFYFRHKDGSYRLLEMTLNNLLDNPAIAGVVINARDITAREKAEKALRENEEKYRTLFEASPESITLIGLDGTILDCNARTLEIIGKSKKGIIDKPFHELGLLTAQDLAKQLDILAQLVEGQDIGPQEIEIVRDGRDSRWLEVFSTPLCKDGAVYAIQVVAKDVTQRRWAEAKIRQRNEELTALNTITAAVSQSLDLEQILDAALQETMLVMGAEAGAVHLVDEKKTYTPIIHHGISADVLREIGQLRHKKTTKQSHVIVDLQNARDTVPAAIAEGWQSLMSVPLETSGEAVGSMTILGQERGQFASERLSLLIAIGNQISVAIENARLFEAVRSGRERLQILSQRLVEVQERERRYIARELHDEIGQALTGLKLVLDIATRSPENMTRDNLKEALSLVDGLMTQVRNLSLDLRPTMLDDLGLLPALLWHCGRYTDQTGIHVNFRHTGIEGRRFGPEIETAAYRIVQEALTNVARHASVDEVAVRLWAESNALCVQIQDHGTGFQIEQALNKDSSGLVGMRERATLIEGTLTIESTPGSGTRLTAELPLTGAQ
jgi:PAS domain S-box-containing protein